MINKNLELDELIKSLSGKITPPQQSYLKIEQLYDPILNHLEMMFKSYWTGKMLSPYAKEIQIRNNQLEMNADFISFNQNELLINLNCHGKKFLFLQVFWL